MKLFVCSAIALSALSFASSNVVLNDYQKELSYTVRAEPLIEDLDCEFHNVCDYDYFADVNATFEKLGTLYSCSGSLLVRERDINFEVTDAVVEAALRSNTLQCDQNATLVNGELNISN